MSVFNKSISCVFVGGSGTKAGVAFAGGCTKAWLDAHAGNPSLLFGANGSNLAIVSGQINSGVISAANGGTDLVAAGAEVGMVIYFDDTGAGVDNGLFEITGINGSNDIDLGEPLLNVVGDFYLGGAFPALEDAAAYATAIFGYDAYIFTNKNETLTGPITTLQQGSEVKNSYLIVEGFNTICGDMRKYNPWTGAQGAYYQPALEYFKGNRDANCSIQLDANGGAWDIISAAAIRVNIVFRNIEFFNTHPSDPNMRALDATEAFNWKCINCRFKDLFRTTSVYRTGGSEKFYMEDCAGVNIHAIQSGNLIAVNSYFSFRQGTSVPTLMFQQYGLNHGKTMELYNCVVDGQGEAGLGSYDGQILAFNSVFYNMGGVADYIFQFRPNGQYKFRNCVIVAAASDVTLAAYDPTTTEGEIDTDYCCICDINGNPITYMTDPGDGRQLYTFGKNDIQVDPMFVDPANRDFRMFPNSPCIGAGKPDPMGQPTNIGFYHKNNGLYGTK